MADDDWKGEHFIKVTKKVESGGGLYNPANLPKGKGKAKAVKTKKRPKRIKK